MSGYQANLTKRLAEYMSALETVAGDKVTPELQSVLTSMHDLASFIGPIASMSDEKLNAAQLETIKSEYRLLLERANTYMAKKDMTSLEKKLGVVVSEVRALAVKDLDLFERVDPQVGQSLQEILRSARRTSIEVNAPFAASQGGQMSSRIPISYVNEEGKTVQGFFTKLSILPERQVVHTELVDTFRSLGEAGSAFVEYLENPDNERFWPGLMNGLAMTAVEYKKGLKELRHFTSALELSTRDAEKIEMMERPENVALLLDTFESLLPTASRLFQYIDRIGAHGGSSLEERNCAMSSIASLFGATDLLAESHMMTVWSNGSPVQGSFMATVPGSDVAHPYAGDPLVKWAQNTNGNNFLISDKACAQLMKIQLLDFICGNVDRHEQNLFYQFDTTDPEHPVLTGIKGIDNDLSFGTVEINQRMDILNETKPRDFGAMSESMANEIMALNAGAIEVALAPYKLSPAEVAAVWNRTKLLQDVVVRERAIARGEQVPEAPEGFPHVRIIPDAEVSMSNPDFAQMVSQGNIGMIQKVKEKATSKVMEKVNANALQPKGELAYTEATLGYRGKVAAVNLKEVGAKLQEMRNRFVAADRLLHRNTEEYNMLKEQLEHTIAELNTREELNQFNYNTVAHALDGLQRLAANYIANKPTIPSTEMGQKRLLEARAIRDLCMDVSEDVDGFREEHARELAAEAERERQREILRRQQEHEREVQQMEENWKSLETERKQEEREAFNAMTPTQQVNFICNKLLDPGSDESYYGKAVDAATKEEAFKFICKAMYVSRVQNMVKKGVNLTPEEALEKLTPVKIAEGANAIWEDPVMQNIIKSNDQKTVDRALREPDFPKIFSNTFAAEKKRIKQQGAKVEQQPKKEEPKVEQPKVEPPVVPQGPGTGF